MSYQVGAFCYADLVAAGSAACAQFQPVRYQDGFSLHSITCNGVQPNGDLHLDWATTSKITPTTTSHTVVIQPMTYSPCVESDYWAALEIVAGAVLACWAIWWGGKKVVDLLNWSRGSES